MSSDLESMHTYNMKPCQGTLLSSFRPAEVIASALVSLIFLAHRI